MKRIVSLKFILLSCLTVFFLCGTISCTSSDNNIFIKKYRVKGKLIRSCDNPTPVADMLVFLETDRSGGIVHAIVCDHSYKEVSKAYTNSNGEFELPYVNQKCIPYLQISMQDTAKGKIKHIPLATYLKGKEDADVGDVPIHQEKKYNYIVTTGIPYTNADTLYYNISYFTNSAGFIDSIYSIAVGPFTNEQLLSQHSFSGAKKIHHGDFALENDISDIISNWIFKTNGVAKKKNSALIVLQSCISNRVVIDLDD